MARASARQSKPQPTPPPPPPEEDDPILDDADADEEEDESESEESEEEVVPFLATREKRANAGNRMKALLEEEFTAEDEFKEEVDDVEFEAKDEKDIFDSDFGSTDSGGDDEDDEDAGERQLEREARQAKRDARGKKSKKTHTPFIPSFARHSKQDRVASTSASTLDASATVNPLTGSPLRKKRRNPYADYLPARESSRSAAVAFKESVQARVQETEERRATTKQPVRKAVRDLTQADLIHEALETEEVNRAALLAFYAAEEDRRRAERIASMRFQITGPRITYISRKEGVARKVHADSKGKAKQVEEEQMESGRRRLIEVIGEAGALTKPPQELSGQTSSNELASEIAHIEAGAEEVAVVGNADAMQVDALASTASLPAAVAAEAHTIPPSSFAETQVVEPAGAVALVGEASSAPTVINDSLTLRSDPQLLARANVGAHARNYIVLEDFEGTRTEEMQAYFGQHWPPAHSLPPARAQPRTQPTCVLTGLPARYRDPVTRLPYSDLKAYKTLKRVAANEFSFAVDLSAWTGENTGLQDEAERVQTAAGRKPPPRVAPVNPYDVHYATLAGARADGRGRSSSARAQLEGTPLSAALLLPLPPLPPLS